MIEISAEAERLLRDRAAEAGMTAEAYLEELIRDDAEWVVDVPELEEVRAAVAEGLAQAKRGETTPAEEVFRRLREKHGS